MLVVAGCVGSTAGVDVGGTKSSADVRLERLMADFWESYTSELPMLANMFGDLSHTDKLDQMSEQAFERRRRAFETALTEARTIPRAELSSLHQTNLDMFTWLVSAERKLLDLPTRFMTFNTLGGWHDTLPQLVAATPFRTIRDYNHYTARLGQVGRLADEMISLLRRGIQTGFVHPCDSLRGTSEAVDKLASDVPSFAYKPLKGMPSHLKPQASRIRQSIEAVVESTVVPAYQRYATFIRSEYVPSCRS
ncbi:MAG: DUF885 family protein, partial [Myxococcota bacterium]